MITLIDSDIKCARFIPVFTVAIKIHVCLKKAFAVRMILFFFILTHLHEAPVVVHLLTGLEEISPISPHCSVLLCDDGCTYTTQQATHNSSYQSQRLLYGVYNR